MDNSSNIRSLSQEQGKIIKQSKIHTFLACGFGEVGQLRMRSSLCSSEVKEEEWWESSSYLLHEKTNSACQCDFNSVFCFCSLDFSFCQACTTAFLALSLVTHAHMNIHCSLWCWQINLSKEASAEMCRWLMCRLKLVILDWLVCFFFMRHKLLIIIFQGSPAHLVVKVITQEAVR